jgi:hypothetical protein
VKINITAGDCLNEILKRKYPDEHFVPFGEAMITGSYTAKLFSEEFMQERADTHNVSLQLYKEKLQGFLSFLKEIDEYKNVALWFGDEPFCGANLKVLLQTLKEYNYQGELVFNTVIEETGDVVKSETLKI